MGLHTFVTFVDFSKAYDRISREHLWYKLRQIGLNGDSNILRALQALYNDVKCTVRVNSELSDYFNVNCGLKQGCVVSPLAFNLYINDLITEINNMGLGVNVSGKKVSMLLYADDIVLLSNTAGDLQKLLTALGQWCERWGLLVNPSKTKIMQFRPKGKRKCNVLFKCGTSVIGMTDKYKYLGLWFSEDLDLSFMAEQVAASAHRALGLLIAKSKTIGGLPHACFKKLYEASVQSILDYGASVWGYKEFSCIKAVQHRAIRSFLGVSKTTCNAAILGEVGWIPQEIHQKISMVRQWFRYSKMNDNRINRHIIKWALERKKCEMLNRCMDVFKECQLDDLCDIDVQHDKADVKCVRD